MSKFEPHGEEGHLNTLVRDHDTHITDHGKHERVVAFFGSGGEPYCRVDYRHGLEKPSDGDIIKVLKKEVQDIGDEWQDWEVKLRIPWDQGYECEDVYFKLKGTR